MIELVSVARCIGCNACVKACPDNVFDANAAGAPVIARLDDCQTCFLCELYCPVDAVYVSPFIDRVEGINEAELVLTGRLGSYQRAMGWTNARPGGTVGDLSHQLIEPDGTPSIDCRSPTE